MLTPCLALMQGSVGGSSQVSKRYWCSERLQPGDTDKLAHLVAPGEGRTPPNPFL